METNGYKQTGGEGKNTLGGKLQGEGTDRHIYAQVYGYADIATYRLNLPSANSHTMGFKVI